jgi:membrane protein involved in colicin uptake
MMMLQQQAEQERQRQFALQQQEMAESGRNAREEAKLRQKTMQPVADREAELAYEQERQQMPPGGEGA